MKVVKAILGFPLAIILALVSFPWLMLEMGAHVAGVDGWNPVQKSPLWLWLDRVERNRGR